MIAARKQAYRGGDGCHPRAERARKLGVLERGELPFDEIARRVLGARVIEFDRCAGMRQRVCDALIDRRNRCTGCPAPLAPAPHGARCKPVLRRRHCATAASRDTLGRYASNSARKTSGSAKKASWP